MKTRLLVMTALLGLNLFAPWGYSEETATSTTVPGGESGANSHAPSTPSSGGGGGATDGPAAPDYSKLSSPEIGAMINNLNNSQDRADILGNVSPETRKQVASDLVDSLDPQAKPGTDKKFDAALDSIRAAYPDDPSEFFKSQGASLTPEKEKALIDALAQKDSDVVDAKKMGGKDLTKLQEKIDKVKKELDGLTKKDNPKYKLGQAKLDALTKEGGRAFKEVSDQTVQDLKKKYPNATAADITKALQEARDADKPNYAGARLPSDAAKRAGTEAWAREALGETSLDLDRGKISALRDDAKRTTDPAQAASKYAAADKMERELAAKSKLVTDLGDSLNPGAAATAAKREAGARVTAAESTSGVAKEEQKKATRARVDAEGKARAQQSTLDELTDQVRTAGPVDDLRKKKESAEGDMQRAQAALLEAEQANLPKRFVDKKRDEFNAAQQKLVAADKAWNDAIALGEKQTQAKRDLELFRAGVTNAAAAETAAKEKARLAELEVTRSTRNLGGTLDNERLAQSARNYTAEPPVTPTSSTTSSSGNGIGATGSTGASGDSGTSGSTNPSGTPPPPPIPPPPRDARGNPVVSINGKSLQYLPDQGKYGVPAAGGNYYVYNDTTKRVEWTRGTAPTSQTRGLTTAASRLTAGVSGQGGTCGLNGEGCGGGSSPGQQFGGSSFQGGTCGPNGEGCGGGSSSSFRQTRSGTTGWRPLQIVRGRRRR